MADDSRTGAFAILASIGVAAIALVLPRLGASAYVQILVYYVAYYIVLGQSWNLMSGLTGYVSFAHGALAGIGAYAAVMAHAFDGTPVPAVTRTGPRRSPG